MGMLILILFLWIIHTSVNIAALQSATLVAPSSSVTTSGTKQPLIAKPSLGDTKGVKETSKLVKQAVVKPTSATTKEFKFPFELPYLGPIIFSGWLDTETKKFDFDAQLSPKASFDLEIISLNAPSGSFSSSQGLQLAASAKIFGLIEGIASIENVTKTPEGNIEIVFAIDLKTGIALPLAPGKTLEFKKFYLSLSKSDKRLFTRVNLASDNGEPDTTITFGLEDGNIIAQAEIDDLKIQELLKDTKGSAIGQISLKKGIIKVINPFNTKPRTTKSAQASATSTAPKPLENRRVVYTAEIDLTPLAASLPKSIRLDNLKCEGVYDSRIGFTVKTTLNGSLELIPNCTLKTPSVTIASLPQEVLSGTPDAEKTVTAKTPRKSVARLDGIIDFRLPSDMGTVSTTVVSVFEDKAFKVFEGSVESDLRITDDVSFKGAKLLVQQGAKATFSTDIKIQGQDVQAMLVVDKINVGGRKEWDVLFRGTLKTQTPLKPFKGTGLPGLEDIELANLSMGLDKRSKSFFVEGDSRVLGIPFTGSVVTSKGLIALKGGIKAGWKVSDSIPDAAGTEIDKIDFSRASIIAASKAYTDPTLKIDIPQGVSIVLKMPTTGGVFAGVSNLVPDAPKEVYTVMSVGRSIRDLKLQANIPAQVRLGKKATLDNLIFEFDGSGPKLSLITKITVIPSDKDEPLGLYGRVKVEPDSASLSGTMKGDWRNPMGIKGFAISDVAVEAGIDYAVFSATGLPTKFGLTGAVQVGDIKARVGTLVTANLQDLIMYGSINRLFLSDLASLARSAGADISIEKVPNFGFHDVEVKFAPTGGSIGEIQFDPGLTFKGSMEVLDEKATINVNVDIGGIIAEGTISQLELGPVLITGKGLDKTYGTPDDGPVVSFALTPTKQHILISGLIRIFGSSAQTEVYLGKEGFEFLSSLKIDRINLKDIIAAANKTGLSLPPDALPDLGLSDVEYTVGMKGEKFKTFRLDPGITMKGKVQVLDEFALVELLVRDNGISAKGKLSKIECGPVLITGMGEDGAYGTADDGAILDIKLTKEEQRFLMSGLVQLFGVSSQTDVKLSKEGFLLYTSMRAERLTLNDIVAFATKSGLDMPALRLPNMGIKAAEFTVGLKGTSLKKPELAPGLRMNALVALPFVGDGKAQIIVSDSGFSMSGTIPKIDIGPLKLTGAGLDQKYGTDDDGAAFELTLTKDRQIVTFTGLAELLGSVSQTDLFFSGDKLSFKTVRSLFGPFRATIEGSAVNLPREMDSIDDVARVKNIDFRLSGEIASGFDAAFIERFRQQIRGELDQAGASIRDARSKVEGAQKDLDRLDVRIAELRRKVATNTDARFDLDTLLTNQKPHKLYAWGVFNKVVDKAKSIGSSVVDTGKDAVDSVVDTGKSATKVVQKEVLDKTTADERAELAALIAAQKTADAALTLAKGSLYAAEKATGVSSKVLDFGLRAINVFTINKIRIEIESLKAVAQGKMPVSIIEGVIGGKDFSIRIEANVNDLDDLLIKASKSLVSKLKDLF